MCINRRSFWNPFNYKDLAGELGHRAYAQGATLTAYEKAQIPPVASFDSYKTDISGRVPKGTATSITLAAAPAHKVEAKDANDMPVDNRQGTITVSAEGLQVGDAFTIAGVNSVHQITKDTTGQPQVFRVLAVSGTTVTISPKILPPDNADVASRPYANVDANAASSAAITILNKNAAPANLFWADGSVELMYGKLAFPTGQGPQVMTATTEQGATLIMSYAFDHIKGVTTARFTPLAEQYVNQLQNLSSLEGQGQALNQYYNSQQYKDLAGQARYQSLAAAEATGGLGSTATSNQLATIAPTLGQSWLSNQMSNYNNLANIGLGALQGQANAGQTYANNMSSIAQQSAALAAANANKPSSLQTAISGGTSGAIAGAGLASLLGTSTPWGAGIGAGIGLLGSLF